MPALTPTPLGPAPAPTPAPTPPTFTPAPAPMPSSAIAEDVNPTAHIATAATRRRIFIGTSHSGFGRLPTRGRPGRGPPGGSMPLEESRSERTGRGARAADPPRAATLARGARGRSRLRFRREGDGVDSIARVRARSPREGGDRFSSGRRGGSQGPPRRRRADVRAARGAPQSALRGGHGRASLRDRGRRAAEPQDA